MKHRSYTLQENSAPLHRSHMFQFSITTTSLIAMLGIHVCQTFPIDVKDETGYKAAIFRSETATCLQVAQPLFKTTKRRELSSNTHPSRAGISFKSH